LMIWLGTPTQCAVAPREPVTSDAYRAELSSVKTAQAGLTEAQRQNIDSWSAGGVLRWNQILRELVARYNLPPAPRPDDTYVFPDAANPFADPQFPFANPPYAARAYRYGALAQSAANRSAAPLFPCASPPSAARAYSYVALAQFEALKAAWAYKFQYNRPSPSRVDPGVQALLPADVPAYPSEDAVLTGVSADLLTLLFPGAVEEITRKAAQQREAALLSGKATPSDIAAGLALGRSVATVFVARAAGDGMRNAIGTPAQWQAFATAATAKGEIPWTSLDSPPRPPMLPFFGQVRAWNMTATDVVAERPPAPPSTS